MSKVVTACVIIIGNEILSGRTPDINLNHIALELGQHGIQVRHARVIPDIEDVIVATVNEVRRQYDYIFTTGGIGPTHDDITADCIAKAFDQAIIVHPDIVTILERNPAPPEIMESRMRMARVPAKAALIDNPTGGPQGFVVENVYVMAGIPRVMQAMLSTVVANLESGDLIHSQAVTAFLGESQIAQQLSSIQDQFADLDIGSYPFVRDNRYGTSIVIRGTNSDQIAKAVGQVEAAIAAAGGDK